MRARLVTLVTLAAIGAIVPSATARADGSAIRQVVDGTVDRARRSLSLGPTVGAGLAYAWTPGTVEVPISFGVGVVLFDIPVVPSPKAIEEMITSRAKARLGERVKAMVTAGQPAPGFGELRRMASEIAAEVKDELLGRGRYAGRTLERPRLAVALEGAYLPRADAWQVRATVGVGIKKLTLGPSVTGSFAAANGLYLGGELAAHLTPWPAARAHVVDVFVRVDLGVTSATEGAHQVGLGARFLLDLI